MHKVTLEMKAKVALVTFGFAAFFGACVPHHTSRSLNQKTHDIAFAADWGAQPVEGRLDKLVEVLRDAAETIAAEKNSEISGRVQQALKNTAAQLGALFDYLKEHHLDTVKRQLNENEFNVVLNSLVKMKKFLAHFGSDAAAHTKTEQVLRNLKLIFTVSPSTPDPLWSDLQSARLNAIVYELWFAMDPIELEADGLEEKFPGFAGRPWGPLDAFLRSRKGGPWEWRADCHSLLHWCVHVSQGQFGGRVDWIFTPVSKWIFQRVNGRYLKHERDLAVFKRDDIWDFAALSEFFQTDADVWEPFLNAGNRLVRVPGFAEARNLLKALNKELRKKPGSAPIPMNICAVENKFSDNKKYLELFLNHRLVFAPKQSLRLHDLSFHYPALLLPVEYYDAGISIVSQSLKLAEALENADFDEQVIQDFVRDVAFAVDSVYGDIFVVFLRAWHQISISAEAPNAEDERVQEANAKIRHILAERFEDAGVALLPVKGHQISLREFVRKSISAHRASSPAEQKSLLQALDTFMEGEGAPYALLADKQHQRLVDAGFDHLSLIRDRQLELQWALNEAVAHTSLKGGWRKGQVSPTGEPPASELAPCFGTN